jgi:hypothetical protein
MDSRSISSTVPPRSGVNFVGQSGTVIEFEIPGNRNQEFLDLNNNLKFKLPVTVTGGVEGVLDRCGAYGLIQKMEFVQNGTVLCSIPKYNVLITALTDLQVSQGYKASSGRLLEGMEGDVLRGAKIVGGASRTFFLSPLAVDLAMTTPHRNLWLGTGASITVRLTLEAKEVAFKTIAAAAITSYTIDNPQMLMESTFLERETMDALDKAVGGQYKMLCNSYDHMSAVIPAGTTSSHIKLSFQKASLERILFTIRPSSHSTGACTQHFSLGSRGTATLQEFQVEIAGVDYPQQPIKVEGEGGQVFYELLKSDNIASNFGHDVTGLMNSYTVTATGNGTSSLGSEPQTAKSNPFMLPGAADEGINAGKSRVGDGAGANAAEASDIGTFMAGINFESNLATSNNSPLYSGVNTKSGVDLYFKARYAAVPVDCVINFYSLSSELIYVEPDVGLWSKKA